MVVRSLRITLAVAAAALLIWPAGARPAQVFEPGFKYSLSVSLDDRSIGAAPRLKLTLAPEAGNGMDLKSVVLVTPPGLSGNPEAVERCLNAQAASISCPPGSRVGSVAGYSDATVRLDPNSAPSDPNNVRDFKIEGEIYNGQPVHEGTNHRLVVIARPLVVNVYLGGYVCREGTSCSNSYDWRPIDFFYSSEELSSSDVLEPGFERIIENLPEKGFKTDSSRLTVGWTILAARPIVLNDEITLRRDFDLQHEIVGIPRTFLEDDIGAVDTYVKPPYSLYMSKCRYIAASVLQRMRDGDFSQPAPDTDCQMQKLPVYGDSDLDLKSLELEVDGTAGSKARPFMANPTSCGSKRFEAALSSWPGVRYGQAGPGGVLPVFNIPGKEQVITSEIEMVGCPAGLPFTPRLQATHSPASTASAASVELTVSQPPRQANIKQVVVTLPKVGLDLGRIPNPCDHTLATSSCPAASQIATVTAKTPLMSQPLTGAVFLRSVGQDGKLGISAYLSGRLGLGTVGLEIDGQMAIDSGTGAVEVSLGGETLPDLPVEEIRLMIDRKLGLIKNPLKGGRYTYSAQFNAWSGASYSSQAQVVVAAKPRLLIKRRKGGLDLTVRKGREAAGLMAVRFLLPRKIAAARAIGKGAPLRGWGVTSGRRSKVTVRRRTAQGGQAIDASMPIKASESLQRKGYGQLTLSLRRICQSRKGQRGHRSKSKLVVRARAVDATGKSTRLARRLSC